MERLYHLTKSEGLSLPIIERLFQRTEFYEEGLRKKVTERIALPRDLDGVRVYIVFLEESTRTYSTFNSAALELGALVTGFPLAKVFSSFAKEEALKHAMEFWSGAGISYLRLADILSFATLKLMQPKERPDFRGFRLSMPEQEARMANILLRAF